jgi:hypothetical protein
MKQQFTEALDRTSTISKRLYHEWENLSADRTLDDPQIRSYDDDVWHAHPLPRAAAADGSGGGAALARSAVSAGGDPLSGAASLASPYHPAHPPPPPSQQHLLGAGGSAAAAAVAAEMEGHLAAVHRYCAGAHAARRDVPPSVWESLARLEQLRRSLLAPQQQPPPPPLRPAPAVQPPPSWGSE